MDFVRVDQKGFEVAKEEVRPVLELSATYLSNEETVLFLGNTVPIGRLYPSAHGATTTVGSILLDAETDSAPQVHPHLSCGLNQIGRRGVLQPGDDQMLTA